MRESITFKILVVGPFGVGKTTFIDRISEVPVVGTEAPTTGEEARVKNTTTVGIEYGLFSVSDDDLEIVLLLFGTPGQDRFSEIRQIAARGLDGLLILVDGTDQASWPTVAEYRAAFGLADGVPTVIALNRLAPEAEPPSGLADALGLDDDDRVVQGNVVDEEEARSMLIEVLSAILDRESSGIEQDLERERV